VDPADSIFLEIPDASFTFEREVRLVAGRLEERLRGPLGFSAWGPLVPVGRSLPERFARLSADGDNLFAIDEAGRTYYMKFVTRRMALARFGLPILRRAQLTPPPDARAVAVSHRGPLVGGYEDIDGNPIINSAGVSSVYFLTQDGLRIVYGDPWLRPTEPLPEIGVPLRGRLVCHALSASASTLFVLADNGDMFTRLADFDTIGDDPALWYTYEHGRRAAGAQVRALPGEDWRPQPRIAALDASPPARLTGRITIRQTGPGNAGRELRVEGTDGQGRAGYFHKAIFAEEWAFRATGHPLPGAFLDTSPRPPRLGPPRDRDLVGTLTAPALGRRTLTVELRGWNSLYNPATLRIRGEHETIDCLLHSRVGWLPSDGPLRRMRGALLVPEALRRSEDPALARLVHHALRGQPVVDLTIRLDGDRVALRERGLCLWPAGFRATFGPSMP
jgi:hypothetical protein